MAGAHLPAQHATSGVSRIDGVNGGDLLWRRPMQPAACARMGMVNASDDDMILQPGGERVSNASADLLSFARKAQDRYE